MMYNKLLNLTVAALTLLMLSPCAFCQSSKNRRKSDAAKIEQLNQKLDSLQKAYDRLYEDYRETNSTTEDYAQQEERLSEHDAFVSSTDYTPGNIDSLLNIYYLQKRMDINDFNFESIERDTLTSSIPDSVYVARLNRLNSFIPLQWNRFVKNSIIRYTDRIPSVTRNIVSLGTYYLPQFEEIFDSYDLPKELKAMAVIESAFNPTAVSRARARGMWQFMYTSAKQYGLQMTSFVDERYDPIASCHAAAKLLRDNYRIFGDWSLAIAAYNCGSGNVSKAIRRSGGKTNFWDIYEYLPRETRGYIPAFIAALYILQYYPEHGITLKPISLPAHVDTFHINRMLHFQQIADNTGISVQELRDVNPQYLHDIIPGTEREYILRIPHNYSMAFVDKEEEIYTYKDSLFFNDVAMKKIKDSGGSDGHGTIHKVKRGETLGGIARKYHTTVANIKRWNGLKSTNIRVGQKLSIYGPASSSASKTSSGKTSSSGAASAGKPDSPANSASASKQTPAGNASQSQAASSSGESLANAAGAGTTDRASQPSNTAAVSESPSNNPAGNSSEGPAYVTITIKKGDTLYSLARNHGMTLKELLDVNGLAPNAKIYAGKKIRVRKAN